jgi:hypothetical protein
MTKKLLLFLPLVTALLFLAGALRPGPVSPACPFVPQTIALAGELADPKWTAVALLDRAVERLAPARLSWLKLVLWQRMTGGDVHFESEGTLQLGPQHCARLDLNVRTEATAGRWLVVSDGNAVAHVVQLGSAAPTVTSKLLKPPGQPATPPAQTLRDLGCGGPRALLEDLRGRLRDVTAQTGRLDGQPMVRLYGRHDNGQLAAHGGTVHGATVHGGTAVPADFCYLYLDAQSLWPARIEWWGRQSRPVPGLLLEMEFRRPELNRPLSLDECIRAFSYRPDEGT